MGGEEEVEKVDVADLENGPLTEANRECRDVICCLLFLAAIVAMIYLGAYGYAQGNVSNIFRGVDQNGRVCGEGTQVNFPYLYLTNPLNSLNLKACVNMCPYWTGSAVFQVSCSDSSICNSNTYDATIDNQGGGTYSGSNTFLGYETYLVLDRICVPTATMFTTGLKSAAEGFTSALSSGKLGNFINDIKNVQLLSYRIGNGSSPQLVLPSVSPSSSCSC